MATQNLEQNKIEAGEKLLKSLDTVVELDIVSALWYYHAEEDKWELFIYPPKYNENLRDQRDFYRLLQKHIDQNEEISKYISVSDVRLIANSKNNVIDLLKNIIRTAEKAYCVFTLKNSNINGFYIDHIILYRNNIS